MNVGLYDDVSSIMRLTTVTTEAGQSSPILLTIIGRPFLVESGLSHAVCVIPGIASDYGINKDYEYEIVRYGSVMTYTHPVRYVYRTPLILKYKTELTIPWYRNGYTQGKVYTGYAAHTQTGATAPFSFRHADYASTDQRNPQQPVAQAIMAVTPRGLMRNALLDFYGL